MLCAPKLRSQVEHGPKLLSQVEHGPKLRSQVDYGPKLRSQVEHGHARGRLVGGASRLTSGAQHDASHRRTCSLPSSTRRLTSRPVRAPYGLPLSTSSRGTASAARCMAARALGGYKYHVHVFDAFHATATLAIRSFVDYTRSPYRNDEHHLYRRERPRRHRPHPIDGHLNWHLLFGQGTALANGTVVPGGATSSTKQRASRGIRRAHGGGRLQPRGGGTHSWPRSGSARDHDRVLEYITPPTTCLGIILAAVMRDAWMAEGCRACAVVSWTTAYGRPLAELGSPSSSSKFISAEAQQRVLAAT